MSKYYVNFTDLRTFVLYRSLQKSHHDHFNMFFIESENNHVNMIIPSNVTNLIAIAVSVQIVAISTFFLNHAALSLKIFENVLVFAMTLLWLQCKK